MVFSIQSFGGDFAGNTSVPPKDIPIFLVKDHIQRLNGFSVLDFAKHNNTNVQILSEIETKNLIRSEVLFFLIKQRGVTPSELFNELKLFDTYRFLIDTTPSHLWRDLTYLSTDSRFIYEQIETAYRYYQGKLLTQSFEDIAHSLPSLEEESDVSALKAIVVMN